MSNFHYSLIVHSSENGPMKSCLSNLAPLPLVAVESSPSNTRHMFAHHPHHGLIQFNHCHLNFQQGHQGQVFSLTRAISVMFSVCITDVTPVKSQNDNSVIQFLTSLPEHLVTQLSPLLADVLKAHTVEPHPHLQVLAPVRNLFPTSQQYFLGYS